jgi:superfamily II DNA or RNA helicase
MVTKKDEKQSEAHALWLESARRNTIISGTGTGKSKIAIDILKTLFALGELDSTSKILLLTNSTNLRDNNWRDDFIKWDALWIWNLIVSECYQTTFRWTDTEWDFGIWDELDFALTDEYSKTFTNNKFNMVLGLTGFIDSSKRAMLETIAPVIMEYSTQEAQEDGILNKTQFIFVEYNLSADPKDMTVEYKDKEGNMKSFTQSENDSYDYIENSCNITWGKIVSLNNLRQKRDLTTSEAFDLRQLEFDSKRATANRKKILLNNKASITVSRKLIEGILTKPNNRVLVFNAYTEHAEKISEFTYHGKNKKGNTSLEDLSSGKIREVGVCNAVNRGANLVGVNFELMSTYIGSETDFVQRHGRGCRLDVDDIMYLYILLPYYLKKVKSQDSKGTVAYVRRPTQMVTWAEKMLANQTLNNPITIRYDAERDTFIPY